MADFFMLAVVDPGVVGGFITFDVQPDEFVLAACFGLLEQGRLAVKKTFIKVNQAFKSQFDGDRPRLVRITWLAGKKSTCGMIKPASMRSISSALDPNGAIPRCLPALNKSSHKSIANSGSSQSS